MQNNNPTNSAWQITKPCPASWDKMPGNDRRRYCGQCQKYVHNISAMAPQERVEFATPQNQQECIVFCQRPDGSVADLSRLAGFRRSFPLLRLMGWSVLITLLPGVLTGCFMGKRVPSKLVPLRNSESNLLSQPAAQVSADGGPQP